VKKVLLEIIKLLWKLFKLTFWKWVRPWIGKILIVAFAFIAIVTVLGILIAGTC
jgi:hypothetical protein